jgi:NAD(P)H-dependent FMN reductase
MKIMVIVGSVREGRAADTIASWVEKNVSQYEDIELDVADLKNVNLPFFNSSAYPAAANGQYDSPKATAWAQRVAEADGFILLVAEYNHGYTAVLKNALDWVAQGWWGKPVSFVSYGGISGGIRAVQQLRQVVLELRMVPVHDAVYIPFFHTAFDKNDEPVHDSLNQQLGALVSELTTWVKRLKKSSDKQQIEV